MAWDAVGFDPFERLRKFARSFPVSAAPQEFIGVKKTIFDCLSPLFSQAVGSLSLEVAGAGFLRSGRLRAVG